MQPDYYVSWYRLDRSDRYFIWYTLNRRNVRYDGDGVWHDGTGRAPVFASQEAARLYASRMVSDVMPEEPLRHNLDRIKHLLDLRENTASRKRNSSVDCEEVLAAWNLFGDVQYSLYPKQGTRIPRRQKPLYNKVFVGNNLPSLTPPGKHYTPLWNNKELRQLRFILCGGLRLLRKTIRLTAGEQT